GHRKTLPRRDLTGQCREGLALLLHVRPSFLLDENHAGCPRLCRAITGGRTHSDSNRYERKGRRVQEDRSRDLSIRLLKMVLRQGRRRDQTGGVPSGAHGATNKEHHVCARRRVGEAAGSPLRISMNRERSWRTFSASCQG